MRARLHPHRHPHRLAPAVALAAVAALAAVSGCKSQAGGVSLTIIADGALPDSTVAAIRILEVGVSGAATTNQSYLVDQPFSSGRQERLAVRTSASGTLVFSVLARAAGGNPLAYGQTMVALKSGEAVSAQVVLTADLPPVDMGAGDLGTDGGVGTGPSLQLVAGRIGGLGSADGTGAAARFFHPRGLAVDGGNLYVTDLRNDSIRKIVLASGAVSTIAGAALSAGNADGVGSAARFNRPHGIASDGSGNLYVADMYNHTIRKIVLATGAVSTIAGTPGNAGSSDGSGAAARFNKPHALAWDGAGALYVADAGNQIIRKLVVAGAVVTTVAGTAGMRAFADGTGAAARFAAPHALTFHNGNLYVADTGNHAVRQIVVATGVVTTLAGSGGNAGFADGAGGAARFNKPRGLIADGAGTLYVADTDNQRLRAVSEATGQVSTVAGQKYGSVDGIGAGASFAAPMAIAVDGAGNLYCGDGFGDTIRKLVVASAQVTTVAGAAGAAGLVDGRGADALLSRPHGISVDGKTLWVADKNNHVIRKTDLATNTITTVAGSGQAGSADGVGASAQFNRPFVAVSDGAGALYVADGNNHTIRKIDVASAAVTTLAGTAGQVGSADGTGAAARFNTPAGLAYGAGALYVGDANNHVIRKIVVASGAVTTLAGTAGMTGAADGSGAAARFNNPVGLALDGSGNLFVADQGNHTIRKVALATAAVSTLAGGAGMSGSVDGTAAAARFNMPQTLVVDGAGNLLVTDTRNHTVRKVSIQTGVVSTLIGNPAVGAVQLGPLPGALNTPTGIALAADGALYLTTTHENAVLVVK